MYVPQGLRYAKQLKVTNNSTTTTLHNYVVLVHLSGQDAADIYNGARDKITFTDVCLWYGTTQIDLDIDQTSYGLWSTSNVCFWFKTAQDIPYIGSSAGPNTDSNYVLGYGAVVAGIPATMAVLGNIYPFADTFLDATLFQNQWTQVKGSPGASISIDTTAPGILTITAPAGSGNTYIQSAATSYGAGYCISQAVKIPVLASMQAILGGFRTGVSTPSPTNPSVYVGSNAYHDATKWHAQINYGSGAPTYTDGGTLATGVYKAYSIARDASGNPYFFTDPANQLAAAGGANATSTRVQLIVTNNGTTALTALWNWVKVRPYLRPEPSVSVVPPMGGGTQYTALGYPRIANVEALNDSGTQYTMLGRYAFIIANRGIQASTIAAVRNAAPNAGIIVYQASEEVNFIYTPIFNGLTIYDPQSSGMSGYPYGWWLFYQPFGSLTSSIDNQASTTSVPVDSVTNYYTSGSNDIPYIRIGAETMQVTGVSGTTLTVIRGAFKTTIAAHNAGDAVKQHVGNSQYSSVLLNVTAACPLNGSNQAWVDYLAQQVIAKLSTLAGLDGVFLDNVNTTPTYITNATQIDANNDGTADNATGWTAGEQALQTKIRADGAVVAIVGNGFVYAGLSDGREIESFPNFDDPYAYSPPFLANSIFPTYLLITGTPGAFAPAGRYVANAATIVNPDTANTGTVVLLTMRFALGLALLGNGVFAYDYGSHIHGNSWWYDEYDNGAGSSLANAMSATQTTLTVAPGTGSRFSTGQTIYVPNDATNDYPPPGGDPRNDETMTISSIVGDVLTVVRGVGNGGVGYVHMAGAKVFTAAQLAAGLGWLGLPIGNPITLLKLSVVSPALQNTDFNMVPGTGGQVFANWTFTVLGSAVASISQDSNAGGAPGSSGGTNAAKIVITTADVKWHVVLYQSANTFKSGHTYTLTFAAKTDQVAGFDLQVALQLSDSTLRAKQDYVLGTAWQQYTLTVTASIDDSSAIFAYFNLGAQTGTVWIDAVTVQEGDPNLWVRDYEHGTVLVNATGTAQSYTPPTGVTYTKINGTQDPVTNNGHSYNSTNAPPYNAITIPSFDAVLVSRS